MSFIDTLRQPRIAGFVVFDWTATIIGAAGIAYYYNVGFLVTLIVLLILSVFLHVIFHVNTRTNEFLGLNS
jgi:hypothetical protein